MMENSIISFEEFKNDFTMQTEKKSPEDADIKPINPDDFDKSESELPEEKGEEKKEPAKVKVPGIGFSATAELIVDGTDFVQSLICRRINQRKIRRRIGVENLERIEILYEAKKKGNLTTNISGEDLTLLSEYGRLMDVEDEIPFTDEEVEKMEGYLKIMCKNKGWDMPPEWAMFYTMLQAIGLRAADAMTE
jgi:hypothetical protein